MVSKGGSQSSAVEEAGALLPEQRAVPAEDHRPAQRPRDRKSIIARHAQALFSDRGFNSVPISDIAEAVGITTGAVYRHYTSKQELLSYIVNSSQRRFLSALDGLGSKSVTDPGRSLNDGLVGLAEASLNSEQFAVLWQREARHLTADDQAGLRSRLNAMAARLADTIHAAHPEIGAVSAEVEAWAVLAIVSSPGHHSQSLSRPTFDRFLVAACHAALNADDAGESACADSRPTAGTPMVSRREQILAAAAQAFRHQGYQAVSTDEIGAAAGVAGPALYRHFDTKSDILVTLIQRYQEWVAYESTRALHRVEPTDPVNVLTALLRSYIVVAVNAPDLLAVTVTEWLDLPAGKMDRMERVRHDNRTEWAHWLGKIRPELSRSDALLLVRTAMILVEDTVRVPHLLRVPQIKQQLAAVAMALMRDTIW